MDYNYKSQQLDKLWKQNSFHVLPNKKIVEKTLKQFHNREGLCWVGKHNYTLTYLILLILLLAARNETSNTHIHKHTRAHTQRLWSTKEKNVRRRKLWIEQRAITKLLPDFTDPFYEEIVYVATLNFKIKMQRKSNNSDENDDGSRIK